MGDVPIREARRKFGQLLDRIEAGEEVTITRRGKPVARMVPGTPSIQKLTADEAAAIAERIRVRQKAVPHDDL